MDDKYIIKVYIIYNKFCNMLLLNVFMKSSWEELFKHYKMFFNFIRGDSACTGVIWHNLKKAGIFSSW